MPECDRHWIGKHMFVVKGKLGTQLRLWWFPPQFEMISPQAKPRPEHHHLRRVFLWMPRLMWKVDFKCTHCTTQHSLWSKGLYNNVRLVIDTTTSSRNTWSAQVAIRRTLRGMIASWISSQNATAPTSQRFSPGSMPAIRQSFRCSIPGRLEIPLHPSGTKSRNCTVRNGCLVSSVTSQPVKGIETLRAPSECTAQTTRSQFPLGRSQKPLGFWPSTLKMSGVGCQLC